MQYKNLSQEEAIPGKEHNRICERVIGDKCAHPECNFYVNQSTDHRMAVGQGPRREVTAADGALSSPLKGYMSSGKKYRKI